jgi:hypothetical protein
METPNDLVRNYYYLTQAHTTQRPGPVLSAILKKHGIAQIDPPSAQILEERFQKLIESQSNVPKSTNQKKIKNTVAPMVAVTTGGNWYQSIYDYVDRLRGTGLTTVLLGTISFSLVVAGQSTTVRYVETNQPFGPVPPFLYYREREETYIYDSTQRLLLGALAGANAVGAIYSAYTEFIQPSAQNLLERLEVARLRLFTASPIINVSEIASSGNLLLKKSDEPVDIISQVDLKEGDTVAVIHDNKAALYLVDGLQAWIAAKYDKNPAEQPTDPATRKPFGKVDIKIYTVKLTTEGGKHKQKGTSRKSKKSRRHTRKH